MTSIEPSDVIRLIEQFLKENNLLKTLQSLQDETSVSLNTVDSVETFVNDINSGHWDVVLKVVKLLKLPDSKLMDLYEQIAIELIELRETRAANWLIHKTEPMLKLKSTSPDRYLHLQNLLGRSFFDSKEAYRDGSCKERRRMDIANDLKKEVNVVPPQRLLTLIGDALKWQKHEGLLPSTTCIDIFTGKANMSQAEDETFPNVLHRHAIKPVASAGDVDEGPIFVCCADFSPNGHYLVVGYSTGMVEIRNPTTGRLANDLKFQAHKNYIVTPSRRAALSICFSASELFAIGDRAGDVSVWKLETGQLVQLFKSAHVKSVSCVMFHRNGKEILTGGHDGTIKLQGMRSNKTIRDFRGHKSFVYALAFSRDDSQIISGGSDSTVKFWNAKTAQLLREFKSPGRVHTVLHMTNFKNEIYLVGDRTRCIQLIDLEGKVRAKLCDELEAQKTGPDEAQKQPDIDPRSHDFYAACSSPKGNWIYSVDSNHIYCFNYSTKKVQKRLVAHTDLSNDLIGVKHHPFLNLLATFDTQEAINKFLENKPTVGGQKIVRQILCSEIKTKSRVTQNGGSKIAKTTLLNVIRTRTYKTIKSIHDERANEPLLKRLEKISVIGQKKIVPPTQSGPQEREGDSLRCITSEKLDKLVKFYTRDPLVWNASILGRIFRVPEDCCQKLVDYIGPMLEYAHYELEGDKPEILIRRAIVIDVSRFKSDENYLVIYKRIVFPETTKQTLPVRALQDHIRYESVKRAVTTASISRQIQT